MVEALRQVTADLGALGGKVALVGGLAVSARAEPRFTRDVDFAVAVGSDLEAEDLVFRLQAQGYDVQLVLEHEGTGRLATVRLLPPRSTDEEALADLLFASSGVEAEIVSRAEPLEVLPGVVVPVASVGHLIAMKVLSHDAALRPKDAQDLISLLQIASTEDLREAQAALGLITQRGFDRGKDLLAEFEQFRVRLG